MCAHVPLLVWFALGLNVSMLLTSALLVWRAVRQYNAAVSVHADAIVARVQAQDLINQLTHAAAWPPIAAPEPPPVFH